MFSSSKKLERGVESVARKIGIDPKVASKTWNTMSSYTKSISRSKSKLLKRSTTDTQTHSYQRLPTHHSININTNIHQNKLIKYSLCILVFFVCIILLNFIFTKNLDIDPHLDNDTVVLIANQNETTIDDMDKDIDDLFNKINKNESETQAETQTETQAETQAETQTETQAETQTETETVFDLHHHSYHRYPHGLSDVENGIYYIAMISDADQHSKVDKYKWRSYLQHGKLTISQHNSNDISIEWIAPPFLYNVKLSNLSIAIDASLSEKGRGMELSELIVFNSCLYTFDDRTGIIYELSAEFEAIPRHIVMESDGNIGKGMKIEWATFKDDEELLYIGSIGREYTNYDGSKIRKMGLLWVVTMDKNGVIKHHDWTQRYIAIREITGTLFPGYLWIEAVEWSAIHKKWFIAPRYLSFAAYDTQVTHTRGCNLLIVANEDFTHIDLVWIKYNDKKVRSLIRAKEFKTVYDLNTQELRRMSVKQENMKLYLQQSNKGFSTIRFLPSTNDTLIVAIRTQENNDKNILNSELSIFDIDGNVYLEAETIPFQKKYEGLVVL